MLYLGVSLFISRKNARIFTTYQYGHPQDRPPPLPSKAGVFAAPGMYHRELVLVQFYVHNAISRQLLPDPASTSRNTNGRAI